MINEIKNCVILYLSNDACAKALKHGIIVTIETNPPRCKLLPNYTISFFAKYYGQ
jgi:hypothetical protein